MQDPKPIVLIVDDSDDCSETLAVALHKDCEIVIARSAEEALAQLGRSPIAAIITDLHLPRMDGLRLLATLRDERNGHKPPVMVVSGDSDPRTPGRVLAAGAQAFFAKPYSPSAVRRKLEELLTAKGKNGNGSPG